MSSNLSKIRQIFYKIRNNRFFELFVVTIIILSALNIGLSTYNIDPSLLKSLIIFDYLITIFFLFEITIRIYSYEKSVLFFQKKWNVFDFIIVTLSLIPLELMEAVIVGRLLRVFRLLRVVSFIPQFRVLIESLAQAVPRVGYVLLFIFIETYIFAAIGSILFSEVDPYHWENIGVSLLTLFKVATIDGWIEIMNGTLTKYPNSWFFYLTYIVINSFIFLNMIVGVIIDVMIRKNSSNNSPELNQILGLHTKLDIFQDQIQNYEFQNNSNDKLKSKNLVDNISAKNDTKITTGIIIECNGKILLLQRPQGTWAIPKGHVKECESHYEGMLRELKEETQIELKGNADYLHETTNKTGSVLHIYIYNTTEPLKPIINSEHIGWAYFSKDALPENIDFGLNKYLSKKE